MPLSGPLLRTRAVDATKDAKTREAAVAAKEGAGVQAEKATTWRTECECRHGFKRLEVN